MKRDKYFIFVWSDKLINYRLFKGGNLKKRSYQITKDNAEFEVKNNKY